MAKWWAPWRRRTAPRNSVSLSDPGMLALFGALPSDAGVTVTESTALGLSAVWRAVSLISGTIGMLPMRTVRDIGGGQRARVSSFLDNPGGPDGPTPFEWKETVLLHLLLHGNAFLAHVYNGAGALAALVPFHPATVSVELPPFGPDGKRTQVPGGKIFRATLDDGTMVTFDASTMTHIPGLCTDGLRGLSPIAVARHGLGTAIAGDRAAAKMFSNGLLISGMVSAEEDVEPDEAKAIKSEILTAGGGWENAGGIAVVNRQLKFSPWTMSAVDAQFLQSRQFSIEEIARWYGVPPFELMQTEKQTSWGTGIEAQQRGLSRTVLAPWSTRFEQRLSRLLPSPRFVAFDFAGLERPTPEQEIDLLIRQVDAGLLTLNEARAIRNLPPVDGGDAPRGVSSPAEPAPTEEALA